MKISAVFVQKMNTEKLINVFVCTYIFIFHFPVVHTEEKASAGID